MSDTHKAIEAMWKIESTRLIAGIARVTRDIGIAEELAQDALVAALERWPDTAYQRGDTGVGPLVGIGVKVGITRNFYVQPSFWAGTTVWLSYSNFSTSRASIAAGYRW